MDLLDYILIAVTALALIAVVLTVSISRRKLRVLAAEQGDQIAGLGIGQDLCPGGDPAHHAVHRTAVEDLRAVPPFADKTAYAAVAAG